MNMLHCDNVHCKITTPADLPHVGWLELKLLGEVHLIGQKGMWHFCSMACANAFTQENK